MSATRPDIPEAQQRQVVRSLLGLAKDKSTDRADDLMPVPAAERYTSAAHFEREVGAIFAALPFAALPSAHVSRAGDMVALDCLGVPVVVLRDQEGGLRAYINACRHRGAQLVALGRSRCQGRITCGYHAWSYSDDGRLAHVPREDRFGTVDRDDHALVPVPVTERMGQIWLRPRAALVDTDGATDGLGDIGAHLDAHLAPVADSLAGYEMHRCHVIASDRKRWRINWKLAVESGLESHHVNVLHKNTIAPLFAVDLMLHQVLGEHLRVFLPKKSLAEMAEQAPGEWQLRKHVNAVYFLPPNAMLLVDSRYIVQFQLFPESAGSCVVLAHMMVHEIDLGGRTEDHWREVFDATMVALDEDYEMAETIQRNLGAGAHQTRTFGRNEVALQRLHQWIEHRLAEV